jgi:CheY-specific phosphatase CheX
MTPASHKPDLRRIGEASVQEVLRTLLSLTATVLDSSHDRPLSKASDLMTSSILLAGPRLSGSVHFQLPRAFSARAAHVLTGLDGTAGETNALLDDVAGELANMVAGRVAAGLAVEGYACTLGIPSVSHGTLSPSETQPGEDQGRADLICEGHRISLEVHCRFASP